MLVAKFCQCEKGRLKRASWHIEPGVRKREEKIQQALEKLPPSYGPVHGLHERNPLGFWEDIQEEHDLWMEAKRAEIEEIKGRKAEKEAKLRAREKAVAVEPLKRIIQEAVNQVTETKPLREALQKKIEEVAAREPGEDQEDENDVVAF